mmetsp:Transcript_10078/g.11781  ORF Transcript_10078/g.11781 Transcript_10078/m.11781 type:complete len:228 (+) Transcript_10078:79-762(+)
MSSTTRIALTRTKNFYLKPEKRHIRKTSRDTIQILGMESGETSNYKTATMMKDSSKMSVKRNENHGSRVLCVPKDGPFIASTTPRRILTKTDNFYLKSKKEHIRQTSRDAFQILGLGREDNFIFKEAAMMKGCSKLDLIEKGNCDTRMVRDPEARPCTRMNKANFLRKIDIVGDKDVWVEKIYYNIENGNKKIFFVSKQTGKKVEQEPPTGASRVIYLKESYREKNW